MSVEHIGKGYVKICVSEEELENSIAGLSQLKPILQAAECRSEYMSSNLLRVVQEQQETIEKQSRLIADLIATLESWEQTAGYNGEELKERAKDLQLRERQDL